jgi:hypothetical protein
VIGGPACAWLVGVTVIPIGQPGTNSAFVLAVLIAVIAAGLWWGIVAACISTVLITYFFIEPRGPHLTSEAIPVIAVFTLTVLVASVLARRLAQARDDATASLVDRERALDELARQNERERAATRAFQSAVLQEVLPTVQSASLEAFYQPAVSMYEIGGDWYDVLEHRDGRVTVTVGDICGKGVTAAAEMVRLSKAFAHLRSRRLRTGRGAGTGRHGNARRDFGRGVFDRSLRDVRPDRVDAPVRNCWSPSTVARSCHGRDRVPRPVRQRPTHDRRRQATECNRSTLHGRLRLLFH